MESAKKIAVIWGVHPNERNAYEACRRIDSFLRGEPSVDFKPIFSPENVSFAQYPPYLTLNSLLENGGEIPLREYNHRISFASGLNRQHDKILLEVHGDYLISKPEILPNPDIPYLLDRIFPPDTFDFGQPCTYPVLALELPEPGDRRRFGFEYISIEDYLVPSELREASVRSNMETLNLALFCLQRVIPS